MVTSVVRGEHQVMAEKEEIFVPRVALDTLVQRSEPREDTRRRECTSACSGTLVLEFSVSYLSQ